MRWGRETVSAGGQGGACSPPAGRGQSCVTGCNKKIFLTHDRKIFSFGDILPLGWLLVVEAQQVILLRLTDAGLDVFIFEAIASSFDSKIICEEL